MKKSLISIWEKKIKYEYKFLTKFRFETEVWGNS